MAKQNEQTVTHEMRSAMGVRAASMSQDRSEEITKLHIQKVAEAQANAKIEMNRRLADNYTKTIEEQQKLIDEFAAKRDEATANLATAEKKLKQHQNALAKVDAKQPDTSKFKNMTGQQKDTARKQLAAFKATRSSAAQLVREHEQAVRKHSGAVLHAQSHIDVRQKIVTDIQAKIEALKNQ